VVNEFLQLTKAATKKPAGNGGLFFVSRLMVFAAAYSLIVGQKCCLLSVLFHKQGNVLKDHFIQVYSGFQVLGAGFQLKCRPGT